MKNSNDTIGNRIRDIPAYSEVRQPTATPRAVTSDWWAYNARPLLLRLATKRTATRSHDGFPETMHADELYLCCCRPRDHRKKASAARHAHPRVQLHNKPRITYI